MHVFLDMDGVIADFAGEALRCHGEPRLLDNWPEGEWDIAGVLGISNTEFWKPINTLEFWKYLPAFPWMQSLVEMVDKHAWHICTAPSLAPECIAGKTAWLKRHFGRHMTNTFFGKDKWLLAGPDRLLIDDNDENCRLFREAGGTAILFPQPWNANHFRCDQRMNYVKERFNDARSR